MSLVEHLITFSEACLEKKCKRNGEFLFPVAEFLLNDM
jgi:hypothetical protein